MDKKIYLGTCAKRACPGPVHVIEPGDTLYSIAQKYHTRVRVLLDLNPFVDIYHLQPGDEICIPAAETAKREEYVPVVIKRGETLGSFLERVPDSADELLARNRCLKDLPLPEGMIVLLTQAT